MVFTKRWLHLGNMENEIVLRRKKYNKKIYLK
jgi:hypothetical protein